MRESTLRDLFNDNDGSQKAKIDKQIATISHITGRYFKIVNDFLSLNIENPRSKMIIHLTSKMEIALESCIHMLDFGYYGSANAIYRQIYEYIVWLKMFNLDACNVVENTFFDVGNTQEAVSFCKDNFDIRLPDEYKGVISKKEARSVLGEYYSELCAATHGSSTSQQLFIPPEDSYEWLQDSIIRFSALMCMVAYVTQISFAQYFKTVDSKTENLELATEAMEIHRNIEEFLSQLDPTKGDQIPITVVILKGTWKQKNKV